MRRRLSGIRILHHHRLLNQRKKKCINNSSSHSESVLLEMHERGNEPFIKFAFFSRKKGISNGIYKSLNCGLNSKDKKSNVLKNRIVALKRIGLSNKKLIIHIQIIALRIQKQLKKTLAVSSVFLQFCERFLKNLQAF